MDRVAETEGAKQMSDLLTLPQLQKMWPHGNVHVPGLLEGIAGSAPAVFAKYAVTSELVVAMMFGQFSEETGAGYDMIENINYSPVRACQLWPSRFSSVAHVYSIIGSHPGDALFSQKLMDNVYGNRMGNRPGTHDGSTYIGRGLSQCTGREGYEKVATKTGLDVLNKPELLMAPATALECGVADFILCGCMPSAEQGDVLDVTKHLNGGTIGLAERETWTAHWRAELGV
jgi:putative chitinase